MSAPPFVPGQTVKIVASDPELPNHGLIGRTGYVEDPNPEGCYVRMSSPGGKTQGRVYVWWSEIEAWEHPS